jgi:hypothetical protein
MGARMLARPHPPPHPRKDAEGEADELARGEDLAPLLGRLQLAQLHRHAIGGDISQHHATLPAQHISHTSVLVSHHLNTSLVRPKTKNKLKNQMPL